MKGNVRYPHVILSILMVLVLAAFAPLGVQASAPPAMPLLVAIDPLSVIITIAVAFGALVGVAALVAALVQLGKVIGVINDGTSANWSAGLNLMFFIALVAFGLFRPDLTLGFLDGYAGRLAQALVYILGFVVQFTSSKPIYDRLKSAKIPLLGYSFSK